MQMSSLNGVAPFFGIQGILKKEYQAGQERQQHPSARRLLLAHFHPRPARAWQLASPPYSAAHPHLCPDACREKLSHVRPDLAPSSRQQSRKGLVPGLMFDVFSSLITALSDCSCRPDNCKADSDGQYRPIKFIGNCRSVPDGQQRPVK